jgi:hypothetical protein
MRSPEHCTEVESFRKRILTERVVLAIGLMIFFVTGYFGVGMSRNLPQAHVLTTMLDERIPFIAGSVWMYLWLFPCALIPLFVARCTHLFRRTAIAYAVVIAISLICFITFPVTSAGPRMAQGELDVWVFSQWAISLLYSRQRPSHVRTMAKCGVSLSSASAISSGAVALAPRPIILLVTWLSARLRALRSSLRIGAAHLDRCSTLVPSAFRPQLQLFAF